MNSDVSLPLLQTYANKMGRVFEGYVWLMIQHLLGDFIPLIRAFEQLGLCPEDTFIIGIPYSSRQQVVEYLQGRFNVYTPSFPIDEEVEEILRQALYRSENQDKKLVIIEDGGYASFLLHTKANLENLCLQCRGIVEQTKQGIWRVAGLQLRVPICTVAHNTLKEKIEAPEVGESVVRNITDLLRHEGFLPGKKVLVIGYGAIGEATAQGLKKQNAIVRISDSDSVRQLIARFNGFETGPIDSLLSDSDLVIGTTGSCTIGDKEIPLLKHGVVLVNASSKRVEIDIDALEAFKQQCTSIECGLRYNLLNNRDVLLLGNGFPINFLDESVPDRVFDLILTELLMCTAYLITTDLEPGIYKECVDENEIADIFHSIHFSSQ